MAESSKNDQGALALIGVTAVRDKDIVCGRSSLALRHPGNLTYRNIVGMNREPYATCPKAGKIQISKSVVAAIRGMGGRFLERELDPGDEKVLVDDIDGTANNPVMWRDIGDRRAIEKTSQALREGQPKLLEKLVTQTILTTTTTGTAAAATTTGDSNATGDDAALQSPQKRKCTKRVGNATLKIMRAGMASLNHRAGVTAANGVKMQCLGQNKQQQHQLQRNPGTWPLSWRTKTRITIIGGFIGRSLFTRCCGFLSLSDVHSASLACIEWRDYIGRSATLWEGLIERQYPSHRQLPEGWCTIGRREFIQRMTRMKCQHAPVRYWPGLPIPLQGKVPGARLKWRWQPEAIIFTVDVFSGRHDFDDDVAHYPHDPVEAKKKLGRQVPIYSTCIRVPSSDHADGVGADNPFRGLTLDSKRVCVYEELQMSPECEEDMAAIAAIENFHDATIGNETLNNGLYDVEGLFIEMSYYVEGQDVPQCEPIPLLSEHHTFFVNREDGRMTYRTDVQPAWLPGRYDWDKCQSVWNKEEALQRKKILSRQISKYGSVPLPFDPQVELRFSPPGERSTGHLWGDAFENDSRDKCSIFVEVGFSIGEGDFDCCFSKLVVPSLLSLWNDAARQKFNNFL